MGALRLGVLAYPGCFAAEVFGVPDLLTMAMHVPPAKTHYHASVISPRRRVVAAGGVPIAVSPDLDVDILVVPGFEIGAAAEMDRIVSGLGPEIGVIQNHAAAGRVVVSVCVGAFLLAEAGLLARRRATTAWFLADELARRCPSTQVQTDELVVTDAGVTTTAAFSAMYDFALNLIREHSGETIARITARLALLDDARNSQAPYVDTDLLPRTGDDFASQVMRHLDQDIARPYHLAALAGELNVSTRTLLRRFSHHSGQTPLEYLQRSRVRRARHLLETTDSTVAAIANAVGYRDVGAFSSLFVRHTGMRPRDYRAAFGRRGR